MGDASDSYNNNWIDIVRNNKGVKQSKKQANEISNFRMLKVPQGTNLIDLVVAQRILQLS